MIQEPVEPSDSEVHLDATEALTSDAVEAVMPRAAEPSSEPTTQSELDLGVLSTGSAVVDAALLPLESLGGRSVADHAAVYEQVLTDLTEAMNEPAARPGNNDAATPTG